MKKLNRIGIGIEDAKKLSKKLNVLLSNFQIFYINVRGYHWNIMGEKFFELHTKFEELYTDLQEKNDEIAERILTLANTPFHSYKDYLKTSTVKETVNVSKGKEVNGLDLKFNQLPEDKLKFIEHLETEKNVMMVGDGLNDAGALKAASFGVAVAENTSSFTPGSDAIILGSQLNKLSRFKDFAIGSRSTVYISFIISFLYNIVGLYYATTGQLAPVTAAILMPLSSITLVLFTVLITRFKARKIS